MNPFILSTLIPMAISAYLTLQIASSRSLNIPFWFLASIAVPFAPLVFFFFSKPTKPNGDYAEHVASESFLIMPASLRYYPSESREAYPGWVYVRREGLTWFPSPDGKSRHTSKGDTIEPVAWELESATYENPTSYRDGIVNLLLLPRPSSSRSPNATPKALVIGTGLSLARLMAMSTLVFKAHQSGGI